MPLCCPMHNQHLSMYFSVAFCYFIFLLKPQHCWSGLVIEAKDVGRNIFANWTACRLFWITSYRYGSLWFCIGIIDCAIIIITGYLSIPLLNLNRNSKVRAVSSLQTFLMPIPLTRPHPHAVRHKVIIISHSRRQLITWLLISNVEYRISICKRLTLGVSCLSNSTAIV